MGVDGFEHGHTSVGVVVNDVVGDDAVVAGSVQHDPVVAVVVNLTEALRDQGKLVRIATRRVA